MQASRGISCDFDHVPKDRTVLPVNVLGCGHRYALREQLADGCPGLDGLMLA
jgi:hypothetical protein